MERYGDAKLPELLYVLADCPKARSQSVYDRCKATRFFFAFQLFRIAWISVGGWKQPSAKISSVV
jgi:hypothetical protein